MTFVTVQAGGGWDTHGNNFKQLKTKLLPKYDQARGRPGQRPARPRPAAATCW